MIAILIHIWQNIGQKSGHTHYFLTRFSFFAFHVDDIHSFGNIVHTDACLLPRLYFFIDIAVYAYDLPMEERW